MAAAIETENLTKDFLVGFWRPRPYRALDGLTLSVEPGEVFGFLGPNGAGKSTTLKLLMQLIYPTAGEARILGRPVGDVAVRQRIGFLAENPYYYDYLTAEEVLTYFARLFGIRGSDATDARGPRARRSRDRRRAADAAAAVLEGHAAARRPRAGAHQRSRSGVSRRADVGTRSARPPPGARPDPASCAPRAPRCSSARTSSPTPKRSAAAWRSWRRAGWPRPAASARWWRSSSKAGSWWSSGVTRRAACGAGAEGGRDHAAVARPLHAPASRPIDKPERLMTELARARRQRRVAAARCATRSKTTSCSRWRRRRRATREGSDVRAIALVAGAVFRESIRDRVPYTHGGLRGAADGGVVPDQPDDRRAGREDHQGPRSRGGLDLRPADRGVHRHRPGVEGSRAQEHLRAC